MTTASVKLTVGQVPTPHDRLSLAAALAVAGLLALAWTGPLAVRMINEGDLPNHLRTGLDFAENHQVTVPHFLFQVALGGLYEVGRFQNIQAAGLVLMAAIQVATGIALCWFIAGASRGAGGLSASVVLSLMVMMAAPLLPRGTEPDLFLLAYVAPNTYHNPTMLLTKPLLVLSFAAAVSAFTRTDRTGLGAIARSALWPALLGIAKPNYLGCLLPVVSVEAGWRLVSRRPVAWPRVAAVVGGGVLTLVASYVLYLSMPAGEVGGIIWAPFEVLALYRSVDPGTIALNWLASMAFPIAVVVLWPRQVWTGPTMRMAWTGMAIGLALSHLLAEAGPRFGDGNFLWTGQMAVFVLFAASAAFVRERLESDQGWIRWTRAAIVMALLVLHAESGIRHTLVMIDAQRWLDWWP